MNSFSELQLMCSAWRNRNFPEDKRDALHQTLGVCEEAGELCHAVLKMSQGIRGSDAEHVVKAQDAIGDIVIYLTGVCDALDVSFAECVASAWDEVKERNWVENPEAG